jgi:hypothetical protein
MATLESDKVDRALRGKMQAERSDAGDWFFVICDNEGNVIASTSLSKGAKHTLSEIRVNQMAHQLRLSTSKQFVDLVKCTLDREEALKIMKSNPSSSTRRRK